MNENINKTEERLFVLLDTIEQLTDESQAQQKIMAETLELVKQQQEIITQQNNSVVNTANNKISEINITQKRFDDIVYQAAYQNIDETLKNQIRKEVSSSLVAAVSVTGEALNSAMVRAVDNIERTTNNGTDLIDARHRSNIKKAKEIGEMLENQHTDLAKKHYTLMSVVGLGMFIVMGFFYLIIYLFTVPTPDHLQMLRQDKANLQSQIIELRKAKQSWVDYNKR